MELKRGSRIAVKYGKPIKEAFMEAAVDVDVDTTVAVDMVVAEEVAEEAVDMAEAAVTADAAMGDVAMAAPQSLLTA